MKSGWRRHGVGGGRGGSGSYQHRRHQQRRDLRSWEAWDWCGLVTGILGWCWHFGSHHSGKQPPQNLFIVVSIFFSIIPT